MNFNDIRNELLASHARHGMLIPETLKEDARPATHPLHSRIFDCEPELASERYYTSRAHDLIRLLKVSHRSEDGAGKTEVRAFQAVRSDASPSGFVYEPSEEVAADPLKRQLVLADMEREWKQLRARFQQFAEFTEMILRDLGEEAA